MEGDWQIAVAAAELPNPRFAVAPFATPAGIDVKSGIPFQSHVLARAWRLSPDAGDGGVLTSREALRDPDQLVVSGTGRIP